MQALPPNIRWFDSIGPLIGDAIHRRSERKEQHRGLDRQPDSRSDQIYKGLSISRVRRVASLRYSSVQHQIFNVQKG